MIRKCKIDDTREWNEMIDLCGIADRIDLFDLYKIKDGKNTLAYLGTFRNDRQAVFNNKGEIVLLSRTGQKVECPFQRIVKYKNNFKFFDRFVANYIGKLDSNNKVHYEIEIKTYNNLHYLRKEIFDVKDFENTVNRFEKLIDGELKY